jgi:hypothetical protein
MQLPADLTQAEQQLISNLQKADPTGRCEDVSRQSVMPEVRAELVRALCFRCKPQIPSGPKGIVIEGYKIIGALDLEGASLEFPLRLRACDFDSQLTLTSASLKELDLMSSNLFKGLTGNELRITGDLILDFSIVSGLILLSSARIKRVMSCEGAEFLNPGHVTLDATGISIGLDLNMRSKRDSQRTHTTLCCEGDGKLTLC